MLLEKQENASVKTLAFFFAVQYKISLSVEKSFSQNLLEKTRFFCIQVFDYVCDKWYNKVDFQNKSKR